MATKDSPRSGRCLCCCLGCALCRILCFTCYRRICCCCFRSRPAERKEFTVLCLGLEGAGKSSLLASLAGESTEHMEPTMGFAVKAIVTTDAILNVKELGGCDRIRPYWDKYYSGSEAVIFVVDSTGSEVTLSDTRSHLKLCLEDQRLAKIPFLILFNKQDLPAAKPVQQLTEELQLDSMAKDRQYVAMGTSVHDQDSQQSGLQQLVDILLGSM